VCSERALCLELWFCMLPRRQGRHCPRMLPGFVCPQWVLNSLVSQENPREVRKHCYLARFVPPSAFKQHKKHLCLVTVTQQEKQRCWRKRRWCQTEGKSPLFPRCSGFPGEAQFFPVLSPGGVPARPKPRRVLPYALCFVVVCKQEPWLARLIRRFHHIGLQLTPRFSAA